mgnify:CR=1 FL=1
MELVCRVCEVWPEPKSSTICSRCIQKERELREKENEQRTGLARVCKGAEGSG